MLRHLDFAPAEVRVDVGGRCYICRPPSLATVHRFLALFWPEIGAAVIARGDGASWEVSPVDDLIGLFIRDARADWVLAQCVDDYSASDLETREALARGVLQTMDVERVAASFNLDRARGRFAAALEDEAHPAAPELEADAGPGDAAVGICLLAERLGMSPLEVVRLPYEAYLTARESFAVVDQERQRQLAEQMAHGAIGEGRAQVYRGDDMDQIRAFYAAPRA